MPLVNIKVLQGAFSEAQRLQLIGDVTDAFARIGGAGIRPAVHVIIEEVADGMWGIGGEPMRLAEIEARRRARGEG